MSKIFGEWEERLPDYSLSYLINGDSSGLEPDDKEEIDNFMEYFYNLAKENKGSVVVYVDTESDSFFTWHPAFGLACTCDDGKIVILVD